jgi:hypothetical protein
MKATSLEQTDSSQRLAGYAAYGAAICFLAALLAGIVGYVVAPARLLSPITNFMHPVIYFVFGVLLFPVVAALPAPSWAKAAGYGWLVVNIASNTMHFDAAATGGDMGIVGLIENGLHRGGIFLGGVWIAAAAWQMKGGLRPIGLLSALANLTAPLSGAFPFSAIPPWLMLVLLLLGFLLPVWLFLAGRELNRPHTALVTATASA